MRKEINGITYDTIYSDMVRRIDIYYEPETKKYFLHTQNIDDDGEIIEDIEEVGSSIEVREIKAQEEGHIYRWDDKVKRIVRQL